MDVLVVSCVFSVAGSYSFRQKPMGKYGCFKDCELPVFIFLVF